MLHFLFVLLALRHPVLPVEPYNTPTSLPTGETYSMVTGRKKPGTRYLYYTYTADTLEGER